MASSGNGFVVLDEVTSITLGGKGKKKITQHLKTKGKSFLWLLLGLFDAGLSEKKIKTHSNKAFSCDVLLALGALQV